MEQFRIRPDGFKEIKKAMLIRVIPIGVLMGVAGLSIGYYAGDGEHGEVNVLPVVVPMVLGALAFGLYRGIRYQRAIFESYRLILDGDHITRKQHNTPTITIPYADVHEIVKNSNGSFTIRGNSSMYVIGVPSQMEHYEELERALAGIGEISTKSSEQLLVKFRVLILVLTVGLMAAVYISKVKVIVALSGSVLLGLLGYSFFEVRRNLNIDNSTKRRMWLLIIVIASIIAVMYYKLTGQQ